MRELLLAALADVTPLPQPNRVRLARPRPRPIAVQRQRDEHAVLHDTSAMRRPGTRPRNGEELLFLRDGLSPQTLKKLRRGHWVIQIIWTCTDSRSPKHGC